MDVKERLLRLEDAGYKKFHLGLVPGLEPDRVIGVRMPALRALAKEAGEREREEFLAALPHFYYEEDVLHVLFVNDIADFDAAVAAVEAFLPETDNWAVCDALSPKVFAKRENAEKLLPKAFGWTESAKLYTARFGVNCLRSFFLGDAFSPAVLQRVSEMCGGYYLDMAAAWFFCDALIKRPAETLPYFERGLLFRDVHRKAVRKAVESFRVPAELKAYLRSLPLPDRAQFPLS